MLWKMEKMFPELNLIFFNVKKLELMYLVLWFHTETFFKGFLDLSINIVCLLLDLLGKGLSAGVVGSCLAREKDSDKASTLIRSITPLRL